MEKRTLEDVLFDDIYFMTMTHFDDDTPAEHEVRQFIDRSLLFKLEYSGEFPKLADTLDRDTFAERLFNQYWQDQSVQQNPGFSLVSTDDSTPWLPDLEEKITWNYWNQYRRYLEIQQHWSHEVVSTIGKDSYDILALTGDPTSASKFGKRGLVVGNIQSGKTSNFIGLMARAADVGYRYIVILASTTNDLRIQTQKRIEEGFIGLDFTPVLSGLSKTPDRVGVGKLAKSKFRHPNPGTTRTDDFSKQKMAALLQVRDQNMTEPWVFVIKKNSSILRNMIDWLRSGNIEPDDQLFLIDDEADYASVNTKYSTKPDKREEMSRINEQIRKLLALFQKSVYVGYTATPFANILIDQDAQDDKVGADIFPRNFIYTLSAADSYFGASKVLADIEPDDDQIVAKPRYIRYIDMFDRDMIDPKAKEFDNPALPDSMLDAIRTFVLASTIRLMRKGKDTPTSMLINVSPYNKPQKHILRLVDDYIVDKLRPAFKSFGYKPADYAFRNSSEIREIKRCFQYEYEDTVEFSWEEVFSNVQPLVMKYLTTAEINSQSKDGLDYTQSNVRVIAVGGYRLSRGLTLEGLLVSYYSRNTRAYDSLMQMCRWFGHRVGYEDLCRIWMTMESAGWCRFVAEATDELTNDLIIMQQQHKTPLEFGQRVRAHPGTLMITASNKMGAGVLRGNVSLNGHLVETTVLRRDEKTRTANLGAAKRLQTALEGSECPNEKWSGNIDSSGGYGMLFKNVPNTLIEDFVHEFTDHPASMRSQKNAILEQIGYCDDEGYTKWTVLFAAINPNSLKSKGDETETFACCGETFYKQRRSPGNSTDKDRLYIGNRFKVATKGVDSVGLKKKEQEDAKKEEAEAATHGRHPSIDYFYRKQRKEPLLVVHYLYMRFLTEKEYENACRGVGKNGKRSRTGSLKAEYWPSHDYQEDEVAWSISFPQLAKDRNVSYVFNKVALLGLDGDTVDEDENE